MNSTNETKFRFFRVNPYMSLWGYISEIKELQNKGVLDEECPSPNYWEFRVNKFEELPDYLMEEIVSSKAYIK